MDNTDTVVADDIIYEEVDLGETIWEPVEESAEWDGKIYFRQYNATCIEEAQI